MPTASAGACSRASRARDENDSAVAVELTRPPSAPARAHPARGPMMRTRRYPADAGEDHHHQADLPGDERAVGPHGPIRQQRQQDHGHQAEFDDGQQLVLADLAGDPV